MFVWDERKSLLNRNKHGVSFLEATSVFLDPRALDGAIYRPELVESRRFRLGRSAYGRILTVIYTVRVSSDGNETIRIISARQASRKERRAFREN